VSAAPKRRRAPVRALAKPSQVPSLAHVVGKVLRDPEVQRGLIEIGVCVVVGSILALCERREPPPPALPPTRGTSPPAPSPVFRTALAFEPPHGR